MTDDATLRARTDELAEALSLGATRIERTTAARVQQAVQGVRERLALGVDHTVVALAGGTGSGKSSLFNQIARLTFADVGIKRPTTARVTACSWDDGAQALLDWVGVDRERRIVQADELDLDGELTGLVLLDLPDHDSIEPKHREVVDRVLPLVDLLVWVVDPQKYADDALHSGYLRESVGMEASMLVLLNQIDTVPAGRRDELAADLDRLLVEDGLQGVPVIAVSARTGEGVAQVHEVLTEVCERQTVAAGRAAGELSAAARLLLSQVSADVPWDLGRAVEREVPALVDATGLDAVAGQVGAAVRNGYGRPEFTRPDRDAVTLLRARWLTRAGAALPAGWQRSLAESVAPADALCNATDEAMRSLALDVAGPRWARAARRTGWVLGALGVAALVFAVLVATGAVGLGAPWPWLSWVVAGVLLVGCAGVWGALIGTRRRLARRRAEGVAADGRSALAGVLADLLGAPTQTVLTEHTRVRVLAQSARDIAVDARGGGRDGLPTGQVQAWSSTGAIPAVPAKPSAT